MQKRHETELHGLPERCLAAARAITPNVPRPFARKTLGAARVTKSVTKSRQAHGRTVRNPGSGGAERYIRKSRTSWHLAKRVTRLTNPKRANGEYYRSFDPI
jgi:hypothetical protein